MHDLDTMRLATASDLARLQALREPIATRSFRRSLQRLADRQILFRLPRQVGGRRAGSAGFVYGIGLAGQRMLGHAPRRPWAPRPSWLAHALSAGRLYVELREADGNGVSVDRFESEPRCWRNFAGPGGGTAAIKPDAFVRLVVADYLDSYFVEIDCGTESPTTLARKLAVYEDYRLAGTEQSTTGVFPFVLWLVPDTDRAELLRSVINERYGPASPFRVATRARALQALLKPP